MLLNHRELRVFLSITHAGSINAAAEVMGMTQPALSRSLRRLEATLGAALFERHPHGMTLTPFGETLRRHAEMVEFETSRVVEEIRMLNGAASGFVRVGLVPSAVSTLLQPTLAAVNAKAPQIQVQVIEGAGDAMLAAVATGSVDFALIGSITADIAPDVSVTPIGTEEVCVAARPGHPLFRLEAPTLEDLTRYRWVLPEKGNAIWVGFDGLFRRNGLEPPRPVVATNSIHTIKSIVCAEDYLTMMTRVIFAPEEARDLIRPVPLPQAHWHREIVLARRYRPQVMPAEKLFLDELMREARHFGEAAAAMPG
ncbi:HTH-type transcriptional regulator GbpR [Roseivivax jejudonensis]|uniref:HTH-type transcriptional regulator GbpR n=1 Tax=Roseivivax jejudonensis TaxID=1529041 RepID=A0A1X6ZWR2_9RHOB|nr:LysR family transcriptional regulator [Roseivivax jejudonensis]SLN63854.1 HTH-type transcriptional regulator GbpR [Roseivivax jejudonensis]